MLRLGLALSALACASFAGGERDAVLAAIGEFASGDYSGDPDRWLRVRFSAERKAKEALIDSYAGDRMDCNTNAFVVVTRYRVVRAFQDGEQWFGVVEYCRVGSSDALLANLRPESPSVEIITVRAMQENGSWYVMDPPLPRVSVGAVRSCVQAFLARSTGPTYERHASTSKAERDVRTRNVLALEVLRRMSGPSAECQSPRTRTPPQRNPPAEGD
jgi:hypothetical protein